LHLHPIRGHLGESSTLRPMRSAPATRRRNLDVSRCARRHSPITVHATDRAAPSTGRTRCRAPTPRHFTVARRIFEPSICCSDTPIWKAVSAPLGSKAELLPPCCYSQANRRLATGRCGDRLPLDKSLIKWLCRVGSAHGFLRTRRSEVRISPGAPVILCLARPRLPLPTGDEHRLLATQLTQSQCQHRPDSGLP
jgi:hypothetical protein